MSLRTAFLTLITSVIALTGCNRTASEPPPNVLATSVAATRTILARLPASSTPPPTATTVFSPIPTASLTPTITETPTTGPSPSYTPIPLEQGDPRAGLNLSVPHFSDDFSQRFQWFEFSDPQGATVLWEQGQLRAVDHRPDAFIWWSTTGAQGSDVYVEVLATMEQCTAKDGYGLGIRVGGQNYDRGYTLEFSCDGMYRIRKFVSEAAPVILLDWTEGEAIETGPESSNTLGFMAEEASLYAFANGELLNPDPVQDHDYVAGVFSLFPSAAQTPDLTVRFDDFKVWYLPP